MKSQHFPNPLRGEFLKNGEEFILLDEFIYENGDTRIEVPKHFVSDFNSVPRGLWNIFPPWQYPEAGVVHDFLYRTHPEGFTRKQADQIHQDILKILGCPWIKRKASYRMLRWFGGGAWKD